MVDCYLHKTIEALLKCNFHPSVVSISLKTCVKDHGNAIALEKKI